MNKVEALGVEALGVEVDLEVDFNQFPFWLLNCFSPLFVLLLLTDYNLT